MSDHVNVLLEWCAARNILIDTKIHIGSGGRGGIGVYSSDFFILPGSTLVRIPKDAVLSVRTCSLAGFIPINPYGLGAQLSLSCALYAEILKGVESYWFGYIEAFPREIVDLPLFWGVDSSTSGDGSGALAWLTGTEAGKILQNTTDNHLTTLEEIDHFYWNIAESLFLRYGAKWKSDGAAIRPTLKGFYRAFSLVSSRAFLVDAYHGLSMVPIADAFNHVVENHVHLESDYNVCPECGSLHECPHDKDGGTASDLQIVQNPQFPAGSHDLYYEMVSNAGIPPLAEIFNTYGEDLTNAQLLNQYGFVLDDNDNDRLSWTLEELLEILLPERPITDPSEGDILGQIQDVMSGSDAQYSEMNFSQSQLVYLEDSVENQFCLNDEGRLSHQLWIALLILSSHQYRRSTTKFDLYRTAQIVFTLQIRVESFDPSGEDESHFSDEGFSASFEDSEKEPLEILLEIGRMCMTLCKERKQNNGKPGCANMDLFDVLEEIPEDDRRTRLAVSILINERSLLDACEGGWSELTKSIVPILRGLG